jgi:RNA polymerase sigma factor (sigma-70 family)
MFSTPGSPAQFAREIVNASGRHWCAGDRGGTRLPLDLAVMPTDADGAITRPTSAGAPEEALPGALLEEGQAEARMQQLYRDYSPTLVRRLTRETGCRDLALELVHEAFARLLRMAPGRYLTIEQPEAYLRRISANLLRDRGRANAVAERSFRDLATVSNGLVDAVSALESRDTLRRLELAMAKLKPRTRAIFLAHRLDGLSYAEIAQRAGLSVKGVEKQMSKAIAKIDRYLERG